MKIAYISYEYPPETGGGGIGTFLHNQIPLLARKCERVVIFCGTKNKEAFWENNWVFRIPCNHLRDYNINVLRYFSVLHQEIKFDLIEGTDFLGWGLEIKKAFPKIPLVVRLHTPLYLIDTLQHKPLNYFQKLRFILGALKRFQSPKFPREINSLKYNEEFEILKLADAIIAPSKSIREKLISLNMLNQLVPYQIIPFGFETSSEVVKVEAKNEIFSNLKIIFIGRLEKRKGILELANAIPTVLKIFPNTEFIFVGAAANSPNNNMNMQSYLTDKLFTFKNNIKFTGKIPRADIEKYLEIGDLFVFPSHYESFGIACCEAMNAGNAVIGSKNGGMSEIIEDGISGILVNSKTKAISKAIIDVLSDSTLRINLGIAAKARIFNNYNWEKVTQMNIDFYTKIIMNSKH